MSSRHWVVVGAAILCTASSTSAQSVVGRVFDFRTDTPIPAAEVELLPSAGEAVPIKATLADSAGAFVIGDISTGRYRLRVRAFGYEAVLTPAFDVPTSEPVVVEVRASPDAVPLAPLTVVAARSPLVTARLVNNGFYQRELDWGPEGIGLAHFLGPEELSDMPPASQVSDLLRGLSGVYVGGAGGRWRFVTMRSTTSFGKNRCVPSVYLDGNPVRLSEGETINKLISARSVGAIEVYTAINKPAEFGELQEDPCGAIVIWTGERR